MKTNLLKICNEVALNGGISYNLTTGDVNPDCGYMVSLPSLGVIASYVDEDLLRSFIKTRPATLHGPDRWLGIWRDESGMFHLDVSVRIEDREQAIETGKRYNQVAIWDCQAKDIINC